MYDVSDNPRTRYPLTRTPRPGSLKARAVSSNDYTVIGIVLGGTGLLFLVGLLVHLMWRHQKEKHAPPAASPIYSENPMSGRSRPMINPRPTVSPTLPSLALKRLNSDESSFGRLSPNGPLPIRNANTYPGSSSWRPSLAVISESPSPKIPPAAYAGSDRPPSAHDIAADPTHPHRASFLTRSSARIMSILPSYQRNDTGEDIPPAYDA